ncbi:GGDEF domain-containing protein [Neorhizobium lilium]|uniref:diguanylate cyclase n=1 Tax=Neorhizobium lilium TaxID=2503024 RepID=A0A444LF98_9HYPH|nr:GGDEF domain-containing protein [Neorhizobium lilium]RWX76876.1 GGDEF domain-containing protein [Neorhizobium lilium]
MMLDYHSLLLALGFSSACLMVTLFGTWFSRRTDFFLLTLVIALLFTVSGIGVYSTYTVNATLVSAGLAYGLLMTGFSVIYAASVQFRKGGRPWNRSLSVATISIGMGLPLISGGLDGLGFIVMNILTAGLLMGTAYQYWLARAEAPVPLGGMVILYTVSGISFVLCAAVLIQEGNLTLGHAPDNWAETLNLGVCIAGMTGIGALSLALHQWRLAAHHRNEAMTDSLTGLLNRRALFDGHGHRMLGVSTAVVVFDIDRFKVINDEHGHAAGDLVLKLFASDLSADLKAQTTAARLGGEEFALILDEVMPGRAERIANQVRRRFGARDIEIGGHVLRCTVSAGVAVGLPGGQPFEAVLNLADQALYEAKRGGRNRVELAAHLRSIGTSENRTSA